LAERIPRWEAELWSYVSGSDGAQCPLCDSCQVRHRGGWCPSEHIEQIDELVDGRCSNPSDDDSIGCVISCRIFNLVEMLAQKYVSKKKVCYPPVPAELVSLADQQHPIEIRLVPLVAYHGAIWHLRDRWIIQLNENDEPSTRRFTLFHEVFHILAHRKATPVFRKGELKAGRFNELLAEQFATCILMPRKWVSEKCVEENDLSKIAETFGVPKSVACVRLKLLNLI